jgi:capsular polysaccharide biosynthesis protein
MLLLFLGLAGGLGAGLGAALLSDFLDRSVKTERDLERLLPQHPVLLTVPCGGTRSTSPERRA